MSLGNHFFGLDNYIYSPHKHLFSLTYAPKKRVFIYLLRFKLIKGKPINGFVNTKIKTLPIANWSATKVQNILIITSLSMY